MEKINKITESIIGSAIEVHRTLGPGLLESIYQKCLSQEFILRGISFQQQKQLPVIYKGIRFPCGYRIDFVVADTVVIEIKTVEKILPIHQAQILTYMKLSFCKVGLLINFNAHLLTKGIKRFIL